MMVDDAEDMKIISQHFRYDGDCSSIVGIKKCDNFCIESYSKYCWKLLEELIFLVLS